MRKNCNSVCNHWNGRPAAFAERPGAPNDHISGKGHSARQAQYYCAGHRWKSGLMAGTSSAQLEALWV